MKEKGYTCSVVSDRQQFSSSKQVLNGKAKQLPIPPIAGQGKRPNKARQVIFVHVFNLRVNIRRF